jgi:protein-S-isoprenylcysteine O-methyltransferase Ste14
MSRSFGVLHAPWSYLANALLLAQFPLLHSMLLSRRGRAVLGRLAPQGLGGRLATTTYALIAAVQVWLLFALWSPSGTVWWRASGFVFGVLCCLYAAAWLLLLKSIIDAGFALQTGLLGWRAVARHRVPVYPPMPTTGLFRLCRQPIYIAFALTLWTAPTITPDQLVVSLVLTAYCLVGPLFKEARFARQFGEPFARYQQNVPYWLPWSPRRAAVPFADNVLAGAKAIGLQVSFARGVPPSHAASDEHSHHGNTRGGPNSVGVKHLLRHGPPVALIAGVKRDLHRVVNRPPFLRLRVGRHLGCVRRPILAVILEVAEQEVLGLPEENRVVAHVAVGNLGEHFRPYRGMRLLVFGYPLRLDADHHAHALHCGSSHCLFALGKPPALTVSRSHGSLMARARTPLAFSRRPNSKRSNRIWVAAENVADPAGQGR